MIDIHSHILPGVDDGSRSVDMTKKILSAYVEEGVSQVICTPHQTKELHRPEVLKDRFSKLQRAVAAYPVKLYLGAEIYYYEDIIPDLQSGKLLTLNATEYILVEFSTRAEMVYIPDAIYELSIAGYKPIVAHIERYGYLSVDNWGEIKSNGGLIQVNASIFEKKEYSKLVKHFMKKDLVDFIASDCHNDVSRKADFSAAKTYIQKKFPDRYGKYFGDNNFLL